MSELSAEAIFSEMECCPGLVKVPICDSLNFRYRLPFRARVGEENRQTVHVEVILHFRFKRCTGPLVLGDPIYSITLLPGEQVRLFTSDRHTKWSYDSESQMSYRHETTSEESFYTAGMAQAMTDLTVNESGTSESKFEESWAEGGGGASFSFLGIIEVGGGGGGGSYDAESTRSFSHSLSRHARSASRYVAASVRAKSATAIGEVQRRSHAEGESEAQYESSSRSFTNPNRCRAVTYLFHKINKIQHISFKLVAIERRVKDPVAPTGAQQRMPVDTTGKVAVIQQVIPATRKDRLEIEQMAATSAMEKKRAAVTAVSLEQPEYYTRAVTGIRAVEFAEPIRKDLRTDALEAVDKELAENGILDLESGEPDKNLVAELSWKRDEILPTPGILVKGCLDDCPTCEPALVQEIELDLEHKKLENELLSKQIELLEKSQEYRCCPVGSEEDEDED